MNALVRSSVLDGEILTPQSMMCVSAYVHPLKTDRDLVFVPEGSSVEEIVREVSRSTGVSKLAGGAHVTLNGHPVTRDKWRLVRPKRDTFVVVRAVPGKAIGSILKSVLQIALVAVASIFFGPAGTLLSGALGTAVGAAVILGGSLLLGSLFPPSVNKAEAEKQAYSISSRQNNTSRWGPIPDLWGKHRVAAKYAASPYTEFVGDDQYLHMLFVWGLGPMSVEDIRIADTPIGEYQDVEYQTFEGYSGDPQQTLYPSTVVQEDFQIEPIHNRPVTRDAADDAIAISIDLVAPQGIGNIGRKDGKVNPLTISFHVDVINRTTGAHTVGQVVNMSGSKREPIRRAVRLEVPKGRYFVRVTRVTEDSENEDWIQQVMWTALRSYRNEPAIQYRRPLAITAVRIRASKQLSGPITELTGICTRKTRSYRGGQWVENVGTRNPADMFRYVLQGPGNARPLRDDELDFPALEKWADVCWDKAWTVDMYRDFRSSIPESLKDVCAAGRAVAVQRDGLWSVAMEDDNPPLIQMFTPRNVEGFTRTLTYTELPHAFRCKFVNEEKDWIEDELLVYADGYDRTNATLFEQMEFPGVTRPDNIFKHARYRLAERILRRSFYSFSVDAEHLIVNRGDRVKVSHYVVHRGAVQGRVLAVDGQVITLDENVEMAHGSSYALETRRSTDFATVIATNEVQFAVGEHRQVRVIGTPPQVGDLYSFGTSTTLSGTYRIMRVTPTGDDLRAEVELVDDAPGIQSADTGPIQGGGGTVIEPENPASFRPKNLSFESFTENRPTGTVFVGRLLWSMIPPPNMSIASFLVVALDQEGNERRAHTAADLLRHDFENLQDGLWTFRVFAYFTDGRVSNSSDPLSINLNIPWDELGVGLGNFLPDIGYIFSDDAANFAKFREQIEEVAALASASLADLELETGKINSHTFDLDGDVQEVGARVTEERIERESADEMLAARAVRVETRLDDPVTGLSAQSSAIDSLVSRTTKTEQGLETTAESLRGVRSEIEDVETGLAASGRAIEGIQTSVVQQDGRITANARLITQTTARVDSAEFDISGLSTSLSQTRNTVTQQGNRINSEATRLDGVVTRIANAEGQVRGQASVINSLDTKVTQQGNTINAQASTLSGVSAQVAGATAEALANVHTTAGPAGTAVRFSYVFRRTVGSAFQHSGFYVDLSANGPPTVVFDFARFIIMDSSNRKAQPFRFENGTLFIEAAVATRFIVGQLEAQHIRARMINTDMITINGVTTDNILGGAVTASTAFGGRNGAASGLQERFGNSEVLISCYEESVTVRRESDGRQFSVSADRVQTGSFWGNVGNGEMGMVPVYGWVPRTQMFLVPGMDTWSVYRVVGGAGYCDVTVKNLKK